MIKTINILWVDDGFDSQNTVDRSQLDIYRHSVESGLRESFGISAYIDTCGDGQKSLFQFNSDQDNFDLIILDLELSEEKKTADGFQVLELIKKLNSGAQVVLFSNYIYTGSSPLAQARYKEELKQFEGYYLNAYSKDEEGLENLINWIGNYVDNPPINILLMSDLHLGMLSNTPQQETSFIDGLLAELKGISKTESLNYLICTGDFAWKSQNEDLQSASSIVNKMRRALNLVNEGQLHTCPGNHDANLSVEIDKSWESYHQFIDRLSELEERMPERFHSYRTGGIFDSFSKQEDSAYFYCDKNYPVDFISLNSSHLESMSTEGGKASLKVTPMIGSNQFELLNKRVGPKQNRLRILLLHHPPHQIVSHDHSKDVLVDGARLVNFCMDMDVDIVVHGHSHFSGVYKQSYNSLNAIENAEKGQKEITFISLPTTGGHPSLATPQRQFLIARISHLRSDSVRKVRIESKMFAPQTDKWVDGENVELNLKIKSA